MNTLIIYHSSPSPSILRYLEKLKPLEQNKPAYIFTTCGLYSANTLRTFSKMCIDKNIIPVMHCSYRCPATDGTLIIPNMKIWFKFEKDIQRKIEKEAHRIMNEFYEKQHKVRFPRFKLYINMRILILQRQVKKLKSKLPLLVQ